MRRLIDTIMLFFERMLYDNRPMTPDPDAVAMYETEPYHVSTDIIYAAMPNISAEWVKPIQDMFAIYDIKGREAALLLAHIGHESADLTRLSENLHYSAERLMQVWPSRFKTIEGAREYERNPQALANNVYGGRMGNARSNDGWWFRGRGPLQITGRDNYTRLERDTGMPVLSDPDILVNDKHAGIQSACWFWRTFVTTKDINGSTRKINGGLNGLADREKRFNNAMRHV